MAIHKMYNMMTLEHAGNTVLEALQKAMIDAQENHEQMKKGYLGAMFDSYSDTICDVIENVDPKKLAKAQEYFEKMLGDVEEIANKTDYELFEEYVTTKVIPYIFKHENFQEAFYTLKQMIEDNPHMSLVDAHQVLTEFGFNGQFEKTFMIAHIGAEMGAYPHKTIKEIYDEMTDH